MWTDDFVACLENSTTAEAGIEEALAIKQQHLPKRIYKYRQVGAYHINNLETGTIRLSSPESFNDPYDCWLTLSDDLLATLIERRIFDTFVKAKQLHKIIPAARIEKAKGSREPLKTIVARLGGPGASKLKQQAESYSKRVRDIADFLVSIHQEWRQTMKVCSFSAVNDSLLMWGHYADNHRGFCLEYDLDVLSADHPFPSAITQNRPMVIT